MSQRLILIASSIALLLAASSCGNKKEKDDVIIVSKTEAKTPGAPISMQDYNQQKDIVWNGKNVHSNVSRHPDKSLPTVKDETGQEFVDNTITLSITQEDGKVIINKTFTKADFNAFIGKDYQEKGVLEGFVFDKVEGNTLRYAASVCHPQTDEYMPLLIYIAPNGSIRVEQDNQLDTSGSEDDDL